jgi:DNA repair ATPase RecN
MERADDIAQEPKQEIKNRLKNHEAFVDNIYQTQEEIEQEMKEFVDNDEIINEIEVVVDGAMKPIREALAADIQPKLDATAEKANITITDAIKKLDAEKGYGIIDALEEGEGSQN